jgi:hypothetical protein
MKHYRVICDTTHSVITFKYASKVAALEDARKMAKANPQNEYHVLEALAKTKTATVITEEF